MAKKEYIASPEEAHKEALSLNKAFGTYYKAIDAIDSKAELIVDYLLHTHYDSITFPPVSLYLFSDEDECEKWRNICKVERISKVMIFFDDEGKFYDYNMLSTSDMVKLLPTIMNEYNLLED